MSTMAGIEPDPFDVRRAVGAASPPLLRAFNDAGVLAAADVHVARRLVALAGEQDEALALAAAFAVRGPRLGHVRVDLATIRETATVDAEEAVDLSALPWPDAGAWVDSVASSPLVATGEGEQDGVRPLRLAGAALYLDRYWREERRVAEDLRALAAAPPQDVRDDVLAAGLARLFAGDRDERQVLASATAVLRRLAVVAGGPGTGKTTTVARIVALLAEQAAAEGRPQPLVALAAPTGKAAARLEEAVHDEATSLDVQAAIRAQLLELKASTVHRLLGSRPDSHSRFRHNRLNRLPHDVVVVDETSMVSLPLMARLVEAVRPQARLVLVGDPDQLTSIEAGAVLGDVVGPTSRGLVLSCRARQRLAAVTGVPVGGAGDGVESAIGDGIVVLEHEHRFGGGIAAVARGIRRGDADAVVAALRGDPDSVVWIEEDVARAGHDTLAPLRDDAVAAGREVVAAARAGDARTALAATTSFRVLCAHRRGDHGVATWGERIESWLAAEVPGFSADAQWYAGRPLLMTENDYGLRLYNGDTGVVVATPAGGLTAAFDRGGHIAEYAPSRLGPVETVHAMTIHKSQGSQFTTAAVLLPGPTSHILTRELLYTAVTRARDRLILAGTETTVRAAVGRPVARASGLGERLWGSASG